MSSSIVLCSLRVLLALLSRAENCFCPRGGSKGQAPPPSLGARHLPVPDFRRRPEASPTTAEVVIFTHGRQSAAPSVGGRTPPPVLDHWSPSLSADPSLTPPPPPPHPSGTMCDRNGKAVIEARRRLHGGCRCSFSGGGGFLFTQTQIPLTGEVLKKPQKIKAVPSRLLRRRRCSLCMRADVTDTETLCSN